MVLSPWSSVFRKTISSYFSAELELEEGPASSLALFFLWGFLEEISDARSLSFHLFFSRFSHDFLCLLANVSALYELWGECQGLI